ncbi:MAG: hypothetical protein WCA34_18530 [Candidatus Acidiferrales bacterium]
MSSSANTPAPVLNRNSSDDEILGLVTQLPHLARRNGRREANGNGREATAKILEPNPDDQLEMDFAVDEFPKGARGSSTTNAETAPANVGAAAEPEHLRAALDANPELRDAWREASAYRETFATPEEARAATAQLGDLNRMDALFYSRRPEDHAELAREVAKLDPDAFASLARAMNALANDGARKKGEADRIASARQVPGENTSQAQRPTQEHPQNQELYQNQVQSQNNQRDAATGLTPAQMDFFHSTNAAAVSSVVDAIESQVERLLPDGISKSARNRVVGEIYRELDTTLRGNRALGQQMRDAFRSGGLDEEHQRAIVSLVTGRARQALPAVAKRVLNEWTSTVVSANHERRARQRTAERRVDIAGSGGAGNDGRRAVTARDLDYSRMSDADILNM